MRPQMQISAILGSPAAEGFCPLKLQAGQDIARVKYAERAAICREESIYKALVFQGQ